MVADTADAKASAEYSANVDVGTRLRSSEGERTSLCWLAESRETGVALAVARPSRPRVFHEQPQPYFPARSSRSNGLRYDEIDIH